MRVIVHRGTHQIGGSCIELGSGGQRLILDLGLPLANPDGSHFSVRDRIGNVADLEAQGVLPRVPDLYEDSQGTICGLIISHAHQDHYGLASFVKSGIPVYASEGTVALMKASEVFLPGHNRMPETTILPKHRPVRMGPFNVTAFLVDHAAPDALMILVEAEGKRVLYSGDLRAHGRKPGVFERFVQNPPLDIDCLLLEGTMIDRDNQQFPSEQSVEDEIAKVLRAKTNLAYIVCSSQNVDRLVSIYRAVRHTGSILVMDLYTAFVLELLRCISDSMPQYYWPGVRVFFWHSHADTLAESGNLDFLYRANQARIKAGELAEKRQQILMLAKSNHRLSIIPRHLPSVDGMLMIWSQWRGYLKGTDPASRFCEDFGIPMKYIHTSGHATVEDLKRLADAVKPRMLIPVHTFGPEKFLGRFDNVRPTQDGEAVEI